MTDLSFWLTAAAIVFLLVLSGFFSGSETALTAASRGKLRAHADKGSRGALLALRITDDAERLIGSVLLGNNLVNILATSLATAFFTRAFGDGGVAVATLVMTCLVLVFAEVLPKTYAITNAERAAAGVARPIALTIALFAPIVTGLRLFVRTFLRLFGVRTDPGRNILAVREEIEGAINLGHSAGVMEKEDRDRILGALDLGERTVGEIMLHRSQIEMINVDDALEEVVRQCLASNHTRLPVFQGDHENIVGTIHAKDLLRATYGFGRNLSAGDPMPADFAIRDVVKPPYFVPETALLDDQMRQFLRKHTHFALVVDEYGALQGLITLEDIIEEIVGEITDEFDPKNETSLVDNRDGSFTVDGAMTIRDLNRACDWWLPDEEANTIAGLVVHEAQAIPSAGQVFIFHGFRIKVLATSGHRLTRLHIRPPA